METYHAYFDASVRGEQYYIGYIVLDEQDQVVLSKTMKFWNKGYSNKECDSAMAEYLSLLELMTAINRNGIKRIDIKGDNKNVIHNCAMGGKVKTRYKSAHQEIRRLMSNLEYLNLQFVSRKNNKVADKLCREAYKADVVRQVAVCV